MPTSQFVEMKGRPSTRGVTAAAGRPKRPHKLSSKAAALEEEQQLHLARGRGESFGDGSPGLLREVIERPYVGEGAFPEP